MNTLLEYKGYHGSVHLDADAKVLHLRDVVTFEGTTVEEVTQAFRDSVDDYLEFCRERGEEPEKPYSGRFVLRVSPELHRNLVEKAKSTGKSLNAFVAEKLREVS